MRLVVAAVIADREGRFLVARRPEGRHLGGLWEFPGGGVETGEEPPEALERELREELGVEVRVGEPVTFAWHRDATRDVLLLFYRAWIVGGSPHGREGQAVRWVAPDELRRLPMPPADDSIVNTLVAASPPGGR